jgi:hypothetical protein
MEKYINPTERVANKLYEYITQTDEGLDYTVQWQRSSNNTDWIDVPDSDGQRHYEVITRDNYKDFWRVQVTITNPEA